MSHARPLAIVAEDEALIRMEAVDMLEALGFDVLEAGCADVALRHLEEWPRIRLLYTDIQMPGQLDGSSLATSTVLRWPETRIIVCSACPVALIAELPEEVHFIAKPCSEGQLRDALEALDLH